MDFTLDKYQQLLNALVQSNIPFTLRHDVDLLPANSLRTAQIEHQLKLKATYYFRTVPESYNPQIIQQIHALGHEIGYHYESLTTCRGDINAAYQDFCKNLQQLRTLAPITSICMHGSPRSPYDSRDLWQSYDYHTLGITHEPYFDTDFSSTLYLTDTGRRWDGYNVSRRDKIPHHQDDWTRRGLSFHTTDQIIAQLTNPHSPLRQSGLKLLITTHPQRWTHPGPAHLKEYLAQSLKNIVKRMLIHQADKKNKPKQ